MSYRESLFILHGSRPGPQMCTFGTNVRNLAGSEEYGRSIAAVISQALISRETLATGTAGAVGPYAHKNARIEKFINAWCDPADNNVAPAGI